MFHYLNVDNKWEIHELTSSRNSNPGFVIQINLQNLYFSPQMHGPQEETCNVSKKEFQKILCLTLPYCFICCSEHAKEMFLVRLCNLIKVLGPRC